MAAEWLCWSSGMKSDEWYLSDKIMNLYIYIYIYFLSQYPVVLYWSLPDEVI